MSDANSSRSFSIPAKDLLESVPAWECHIHTTYTDGSATIQDIAQQALQKGLKRIIFTEHTESWKATHREWIPKYINEVKTVCEHYSGQMEIYLGIETPALDFEKNLEIPAEIKNQVEFILGAAHRYPGLLDRRIRDLSPGECIELEFRTLLALARNPTVTAISHLGGTCRQYCCEFPLELAAKVIQTARENGVAIELNSRYHAPMRPIFEICLQEKATVTIGSDVHFLEEIGKGYESVQQCVKVMTT